MIGESLARFPSLAAHGAALAARTLGAVADDTNGADAQIIPFRVDTNGAQTYVVGGTSLWWCPLPHERSLTPLGTVVNTTLTV